MAGLSPTTPGKGASRGSLDGGAGQALTISGAGDYDKHQSFSIGMWVKIPRRGITGALAARMDNGSAHRGWDLWTENNRIATHIIHKWQGDALKVVCNTPLKLRQWYHVIVTYDGSAKAAGQE